MPVYNYSKKPFKKNYKKNYKKAITEKDVARIARNVSQANKLTKEKRFYTYTVLKTDVLANSFALLDITNIDEGLEADQRVGRKIVYNGFKYNITIDNNRVEERYIRLMVLQARNANDPPDLSGWTDLYQDTNYQNRTADMLAGDTVYPINRDVWNVYMDKLIKLSSASTDGSSKVVSGYLRFNKRIEYDNEGAGANVPIQGGQIYFIAHACEVYAPSGSTATGTGFMALLRAFFKDG